MKQYKNNKRKWAIGARWYSCLSLIFVLIAIASTLYLKFENKIPSMQPLSPCFQNYGNYILLFSLSVIFALVLSIPYINNSFTLKSLSKKNICQNPSLSFSILTAIFILIPTLYYLDNKKQEALFLLSLIFLSLFFGIILKSIHQVIYAYLKQRASPPEALEEKTAEQKEFKILTWIHDHSPTLLDKFEFKASIDRIIKHFSSSQIKNISIALEGPHGSGKSSIVRMAKEELEKKHEQLLFIHLRSWGMNGEGIVKNIFQSIVVELENKGIDSLSIKNTPEEYYKALTHINKWFYLLFALVKDSMTQGKILERLNLMLTASDLHIVLVIEDIDRNDKDVLQTLVPILDDFNEYTPNISYIFEITESGKYPFLDMSRIFDYIDPTPTLPVKESWEMFRLMKNEFFGDDFNDIILYNEDAMFNSVQPLDYSSDRLKVYFSDLVMTPRMMKMVFRELWFKWRFLHGEVDLIEFLIISIIKLNYPEVFDFLKVNITTFKNIVDKNNETDEEREFKKNLLQEWGDIQIKSANKKAVEKALTFIGVPLFHDKYSIGVRKIQNGIFYTDTESDYFNRMLLGQVPENEIKDQDVLRAIKNWKEHNNHALFTQINNVIGFSAKIRQFYKAQALKIDNSPDLCKLFADNFDFIRNEYRADPNLDDKSQFSKLFEILNSRGRNVIHVNWIKQQIELSLDVSLCLAIEIIDTFPKIAYGKLHDKDLTHLEDDECKSLFHQELVVIFESKFKENPLDIDKILPNILNADNQNIWSLNFLLFKFDELQEENQQSSSRWQWLAPFLIKTIQGNPEQRVPLVALCFLNATRTQSSKKIGVEKEFNKKALDEIFQTDEERKAVLTAFLNYVSLPEDKLNNYAKNYIFHNQNELAAYLADITARIKQEQQVKQQQMKISNEK